MNPNSWKIQITYHNAYEMEQVKWYVRLYRRVFSRRAYVKWRIKRYYFRKAHEKILHQIDKFLAWGDEIYEPE